MKRASNYIFQLIRNRVYVEPEREDTIRYGIEIMLYTVLSTMGLLIIGGIMHRFSEAVIIVVIYYLNQTVGGGYHSSTHIRCFLTMALFLVGGLFLLSIHSPIWVTVIITLFSLIVLYVFPLVLHEHKQYLLPKAHILSSKSRFIIIIELLVGIIMASCCENKWLQAYAMGLLFSALSRLVARIMHVKQKAASKPD